MKHVEAQEIFEDIRGRPYRVAEEWSVAADNCYLKGVELLQRLGALGYSVRGRVGETAWDRRLVPQDILDLYPQEFLVTHFYVEAEIDGTWRALDPSLDPGLAKAGFRFAEWDGTNAPCFAITKVYTQQENIAYTSQWNDPAYAKLYFERAGEFLRKLNAWFDSIRATA